ncbi:MAG: hypothetical protein LBH00_12890 [Planctomycetaceae bacterium]|jgi:hypothetical protein|nr:hypothetical protein [Planctomycetaceae bacterium]
MSRTKEEPLTETADTAITEHVVRSLTGYWERRQADREQKRAEFAETQAQRNAVWVKMQDDLEKMQAERDAMLAAKLAKSEKTKSNRTACERKRIRRKLNNLRQIQEKYAKNFFRQAVSLSNSFCGIEYNAITRYGLISNYNIDVEESFDMILHNNEGTFILIEIEYEFHLHDLKTFVKRKADNFRKLFPYHADGTIYLAIAGFWFEDSVTEEAKALGIAVVQADGENINIDGRNLKTF